MAELEDEDAGAVLIKQELDPSDYIPESGEADYAKFLHEDVDFDENNVDPDFQPSASSDAGSDSDLDDLDYEAAISRNLDRRSSYRHRRATQRTRRKPKSTSISIRSTIFKHEPQEEPSDSSSGEIPEPTVTMTRILHDVLLSYAEVERCRQCFVVLQSLPSAIASRGLGAVFSEDELKAMIKTYRPGPPRATGKPGPRLGPNGRHRYNPHTCTCPKCGKVFTRPAGLLYHLKHGHIETEADAQRALADKKYSCEVCGKLFSTTSQLKSHSQMHTGIGLFPCRVCGRRYKNSCHRKHHEEKCSASAKEPIPAVQVVNEEDPSAAAVVVVSDPAEDSYGVVIKRDKVFLRRPVSLKKAAPNPLLAQMSKGAPRRKVCRYCHKTFPKWTRCRQHEFTHTGIKPYKCTYDDACDAAFYAPVNLAEHVRVVHTGEKPFKCKYEGCGEEFARIRSFKLHIQNKHLQTRFPCPDCDKEFITRKFLHIHHTRVHQRIKPHLCTVCGKAFVTNANLELHFKVHLKPPRERSRKQQRPDGVPPRPRRKPMPGSVLTCPNAECGKTFFNHGNMRRHARAQHGIDVGASTRKRSSGIGRGRGPRRKRKQPAVTVTVDESLLGQSSCSAEESVGQWHQGHPGTGFISGSYSVETSFSGQGISDYRGASSSAAHLNIR